MCELFMEPCNTGYKPPGGRVRSFRLLDGGVRRLELEETSQTSRFIRLTGEKQRKVGGFLRKNSGRQQSLVLTIANLLLFARNSSGWTLLNSLAKILESCWENWGTAKWQSLTQGVTFLGAGGIHIQVGLAQSLLAFTKPLAPSSSSHELWGVLLWPWIAIFKMKLNL